MPFVRVLFIASKAARAMGAINSTARPKVVIALRPHNSIADYILGSQALVAVRSWSTKGRHQLLQKPGAVH